MDEEATVRAAIAGDADALAALLERHGPAVRAAIGGNIPSRWQALITADDLMQQTYTDAFLSIRRFDFRGAESLTAWLVSLARRNLQDAVRMLEADKRGGGRATIGARPEESLDVLLERIEGSTASPSRDFARGEAFERLGRAIEELPDEHRRAICLHDLEGRTMQEVAAEIGRPLGATYMLRSRALAWLREAFGTASFPLPDSA